MSFPDFYELVLEKIPLSELDENWFLENIHTRKPFYEPSKRFLDILISLPLGLILLPLGLIIAVFIRLTSRGPAIYKQTRLGFQDKEFTLYKFRTMKNGSSGSLWTETNDSRITAFGKFLRFTHLDEIPQLWNVLRGEVSLSGPRPERLELAQQYSSLPHYNMRHAIKPGVTGWAQINFKPSAGLKEAEEKLAYDLYYIKNRSLVLDSVIFLKTLRHLFFGSK